jgi:predicted site-specific integrase-resolvase
MATKHAIGQDDTRLAPRDAGKRLGITTSAIIALALRGRTPEIRDSAGRRTFRASDIDREVERRRAAKAVSQ